MGSPAEGEAHQAVLFFSKAGRAVARKAGSEKSPVESACSRTLTSYLSLCFSGGSSLDVAASFPSHS